MRIPFLSVWSHSLGCDDERWVLQPLCKCMQGSWAVTHPSITLSLMTTLLGFTVHFSGWSSARTGWYLYSFKRCFIFLSDAKWSGLGLYSSFGKCCFSRLNPCAKILLHYQLKGKSASYLHLCHHFPHNLDCVILILTLYCITVTNKTARNVVTYF